MVLGGTKLAAKNLRQVVQRSCRKFAKSGTLGLRNHRYLSRKIYQEKFDKKLTKL